MLARACVLVAASAGRLGVPTPRAAPHLSAVSTVSIRQARWPDDYEAVCAVREPNRFVVEDGSVGFMGQTVTLTPEEALERRVEARLGSALDDGALVLLAFGSDEAAGVLGTCDAVPQPEGQQRRSFGPELPQRLLIRNLWVSPSHRRRGIARQLMLAAEELALGRAEGERTLSLEVDAGNEPARRLYDDLGYVEFDAPPAFVPRWLATKLFLVKRLQ
jgi:ribosomal protein S18 acetylase RimI-like enzyme